MSKSCINGTIAPETPSDFQSILIPMNSFDIVLGCILVVGAIVSTIPQHMKILKNKSAAGLSFLWLFLGCINQYATFINGVVLKYPQIEACSRLGFAACSPSLISLAQFFAFWIFSFPFYVYYLYFTPSDIKNLSKENYLESKKAEREFLYAKILFGIECIFLVAITVIMLGVIKTTGECSKNSLGFAYAVGLLSVIVTFVQWTPQIYKVIKYKSPGSFSIIMLLIQGPGTLVLLYYFIFVSKEQIITWLSYLCAVIQLFIVLGLLIYYQRKDKAKQEEEEEDASLKTDSSEVSFSPNNSQVYTDIQPLLKRNNNNDNNKKKNNDEEYLFDDQDDLDDYQQQQQQQEQQDDSLNGVPNSNAIINNISSSLNNNNNNNNSNIQPSSTNKNLDDIDEY